MTAEPMRPWSRRHFLRNTGLATVAAGAATVPRLAFRPDAALATGEGTTFEGFVNDQGGQVFNATNPAYGAKADTIRSAGGGSMTAGSTTFTQATNGNAGGVSTLQPVSFDPATDVGKVMTVQGAGASGAVLSTTITSVVDASTVTLAAPASTTVANAGFAYGTDDTAGIIAAITAAGLLGTVYLPAGIYTIRGASNGGQPILHDGRGGIRGRGGKYTPTFGEAVRNSNTVLLCSDATAGLVTNGCARYESFVCDGNRIGTTPLRSGLVANGAVTEAPSFATYIDVWAMASAQTGWTIYGAKNTGFYDCGTANNRADGIYIDGGASGLDFFHFHERGNERYGIHGDHLVAAVGGTTEPTSGVRFYSGLCDGDGVLGISKVYLRAAVDWRFPGMDIVGNDKSGPAIDLDQSAGYGLDFSTCLIWASKKDVSPGTACIQIAGTPPDDTKRTFLKTDGSSFVQGDTSVYVMGDPRSYEYSANGGWTTDFTRNGPVAAAGLPAVDTLFSGRTGPWQTAALLAPWSGAVTYRVMGEGWIEVRGSAQYSGVGTGPLFVLPVGYRPDGSTRRLPTVASSGLGVVAVATTGEVSASPAGTGLFPANTTVYLDGINFPVEGADAAPLKTRKK